MRAIIRWITPENAHAFNYLVSEYVGGQWVLETFDVETDPVWVADLDGDIPLDRPDLAAREAEVQINLRPKDTAWRRRAQDEPCVAYETVPAGQHWLDQLAEAVRQQA